MADFEDQPRSWWNRRTPSLPSSLNKRKLSFMKKIHRRKKSEPIFKDDSSLKNIDKDDHLTKDIPVPQPPNVTENHKIITAPQTRSESSETERKAKQPLKQAIKILTLQRKVTMQEIEIVNLRKTHDQNLTEISKALFKLQSNLVNKEKMLEQVIQEKDQTIMEQQKVIRRLLKKGHSDQLKQPNYCDEGDMTGSSGVSPASSIPQINEILVDDADPPMEFSISVPNLSETRMGRAPVFNRSISDNEEKEKERTKTAKMSDRLAKKREKLLSMKRYSGFLKRPEILETVYSVEDPDDAGDHHVKMGESVNDVEKSETHQLLTSESKKEDSLEIREDNIFRGESETTEYDGSTDDESLRLFFSETDQSNCCSEICSRRSSSGSQPSLLLAAQEDEKSRSTEDLIDLRGKMKLVEKRRKMFQQKQSVSLDCGEN